MDFEEAGKSYAILREKYEKGEINQESFEKEVLKLKVTQNDGRVWYIEPYSGSWTELEGKKEPQVKSPKPALEEPQTLFALFKLVGKTFIKSLPRAIFLGVLMAGLTWVAHTYIIAKINDGLMYKQANQVINAIVHLQKTYFPGVDAFWGLISYFISNNIGRLFSSGIINWFKGFLLLPYWIVQSILKNKIKSVFIITSSTALALLVSYLIKNFMVSWILSFGILLTLTARYSSMEFLVLKLAISDFQRITRLKLIDLQENIDSIFLILLGLSAGFALAGLSRVKYTNYLIYFFLMVAFLIVLTFLLKRKKSAQLLLLLMIVTGGLLVFYLPLYAWCEGASLSRSGGNWVKWWSSRNADVVRKLGLRPAGSSLLGGILGAVTSTVSSGLTTLGSLFGLGGKPTPPVVKPKIPSKPTTPPTPKTISDEERKARQEKIDRLNKEAEQLAKQAKQEGSIWGLMKGMFRGSVKDLKDAGSTIVSTTKDVAKGAYSLSKKGLQSAYEGARAVYNDPSIVTKTLKSGLNKTVDGAKNTYNSAKNLLKDVYSNPEIITNTLKDVASSVGRGAKATGKFIYNTVTDPKKMWGIAKDVLKESVGYDNFKNSIDPNRSLLNRVGQSLVGVGKLGLTVLTLGKAGIIRSGASTALKTTVSTAGKQIAGTTLKTVAKSGASTAGKQLVGTVSKTAINNAKTQGVKAATNAANNLNRAVQQTKGSFTATGKLPRLTGVSQKEAKAISEGNKLFGLETKVRPPDPQRMNWLNKGVPKSEDIKNKSIKLVDNLIGAKGPEGLIGSYKPDKTLTRNLINNIKNNPGIPPSRKQEMIKEVFDTFADRTREFSRNKKHLQELVNQGKITIKNGVIFDGKTGKPFIPDLDLFSINKIGGGPASAAEKQAFINFLKSKGVGVQHGAHLDWRPVSVKDLSIFEKIIKSHGKGGKALIDFTGKGVREVYYTP